MKNDTTGQEFHFFPEDKVAVTEDNPEGMVELPAIRPDLPPLESGYTLLTASIYKWAVINNDKEVFNVG